MSLRQDEGLPALTPDQQAEAIRLAARLQEQHRSNDTEALLRAAEEAGIERQFLNEAVAQVHTKRQAARPKNPALGLILGPIVLTLALIGMSASVSASSSYIVNAPVLTVACFLGFLFAVVPTLKGRSRPAVTAFVLASWLLLDLLIWAFRIDVHGEFTTVGLIELAGALLGIVLAELAASASGGTKNRAQSL
jgi:hypothetical protein